MSKIKLTYVLDDRPDFDLGTISRHLTNEIMTGEFKVERDLWAEYVQVRGIYEVLHAKMINVLPPKARKAFNDAHKSIVYLGEQ